MLPPKTRWSVASPPDPGLVRELAKRLHIRPLLAALLASRGHTADEAEQLLSETNTFHDPFLMEGMAAAADRVRLALRSGHKIRVYGDYDADGVSSTALMARLLHALGANFDYCVPHRMRDGYGLHTHYIEQAKRDNVALIITVDTGITAVEQANAAWELGVDLIITDHHEPQEREPRAVAVLNPKRRTCAYPFKGLAGVGVAFKLAHALAGRVPAELAEWAALGTVADLMPLVGENRSIVRLGLERLRTMPSTGLAALLASAGVKPAAATAGTIGFGLAPRINAAGRLDSADEAVRLLVTDEEAEAVRIAGKLGALNVERQRMVEAAAVEAIQMVESEGGVSDAIVVASERWNPGIIGIVASKLVEKYYRPTVVIAIDPETRMGKGSARSVAGFGLYDALKACERLFTHFGGHEAAAGLSLPETSIPELIRLFRDEAASRLTPEMKIPVTEADAELELSDVTLEAIAELEKLAPYGAHHPVPMFVFRQTLVRASSVLGKDRKHAKFHITDGRCELEAVGFGFGEAAPRIADGSQLELAGELAVNEWNGRRTPQIIVRDVSVPHLQLFDWRAAKTAAAIRAQWENVSSENWRPVFLLSALQEAPAVLAAWWKDVPAFRMNGTADGADAAAQLVVPANAAARERGKWEDATDVFLPACPVPYDRFHLVMKSAKNVCRLYALDLGAYGSEGTALDRDIMKQVYALLRVFPESSADVWVSSLAGRTGLSPGTVRLAIRVFVELGMVEKSAAAGTLRPVIRPEKRELKESPAFMLDARASGPRREWSVCPVETLRLRLGAGGYEGTQSDRRAEAST